MSAVSFIRVLDFVFNCIMRNFTFMNYGDDHAVVINSRNNISLCAILVIITQERITCIWFLLSS